MKFNKYVTDGNNNQNVLNYNGGDDNDSKCLCIFVIFIILIYVLTSSKTNYREYFTTENKTIDPKLINNPNIIFDQSSAFKKKTYDSNINFSKGCDSSCETIKKANDSSYEPNLEKVPNMGTDQWSYEGFNNRNSYITDEDNSLYDYMCSRPEFIENKLNNSMLGRVWSFDNNKCNVLDLNQNQWALNEGFIGDKKSNDSRVLPFRSLPDYKVVEKFENQNILAYTASKCSEKSEVFGFDQISKCCYGGNDKANMFQGLDETKLSDTLKLLDYASGEVHHTKLNEAKYNDVKEVPTFSNEICS